jgi:acyl-ACP thioesterase
VHGDKKETLLIKKFRYTDIDVNKHVNNTRYIEMILDSYSTEHHKNNLIKSMAASFISESFYDDEVEICRSVRGGLDILEGINIKISKTVFAAQIEWFS